MANESSGTGERMRQLDYEYGLRVRSQAHPEINRLCLWELTNAIAHPYSSAYGRNVRQVFVYDFTRWIFLPSPHAIFTSVRSGRVCVFTTVSFERNGSDIPQREHGINAHELHASERLDLLAGWKQSDSIGLFVNAALVIG